VEDPQHRSHRAVSVIDSYRCAGIEHGGHAVPRLAARARAAAAASNSSSLNGSSSAFQWSSAAPSRSLGRRCAAADVNQMENVIPGQDWGVSAGAAFGPK